MWKQDIRDSDSLVKTAYRIISVLAIGGLIVIAAACYALGIVSYQRHTGYFAPVWDDAARGIYYIQRDTTGIVWGAGWEHFTPPAYSFVRSDDFSLRHVDIATAKVEVLQTWTSSPLTSRTTRHYRGRVFNTISARVEPAPDGVDFVIRLSIPKVPTSETWTLAGKWKPASPALAGWSQQWHNITGLSGKVLANGLEVIAVRGRESFPAALISVKADNSYRVVLKNDAYDDLYPDGVPANKLAEWSRRANIERVRTLKSTRDALMAANRAAGLNETEAALKTIDQLEQRGLLPKRPKIVARETAQAPGELKVFDIPPDYFTVGLFQDIAAAIAEPGKSVDTGTGTYLKYGEDDLGPRLKAWRLAGHDRFVIRTGGRIYLLEVRRTN